MKGDYEDFEENGETQTAKNDLTPKNGEDYNTAESSSVGDVQYVQTVANEHSMPLESTPCSVTRNYREGILTTERYFDESGKPYLDIDYTNHGNAKTHPHVPHEHRITFADGRLYRDKPPEGGIIK